MAGPVETALQVGSPVAGADRSGGGRWPGTLSMALGLGLAAGAVYLLPALLGRPLVETPEARVAVVAREMLQSGEWVLPTLGGEVRLNKPPWAYWQTAVAAKLLQGDGPLDETVMARAVLLPSALAAALTVVLLTIVAGRVWGREAGAIAGCCCGVSWMVIRYSQMGYLDCTLMAVCAVGLSGAGWLAAAPRPGAVSALVFGAGLGLGLLVKGPLALIVVLPALLICSCCAPAPVRRLLLILAGLGVAALIALPWFVLVARRLPAEVSFWALLDREMASGHEQNDRWVYYLYKLAGGFAPWTPILLLALVAIFSRGFSGLAEWLDRRLSGCCPDGHAPAPSAFFRFFVIAALSSLAILYASAKQQEHYLLPLFPPLVLAATGLLSALRKPGGRREERMAWLQLAAGATVGLAVATLPAWCGHGADLGLGYGFAVPAGLALAALHFYMARQWVEGRPARAVGIFAVAVWIAAAAYSAMWTWQVQSTSNLAREAASVREQLDAVGPQVRVCGIGYPVPLMVFYLRRPVSGLEELKNPSAESGAPWVIVARRNDILDPAHPLFGRLGLASFLVPGSGKLAVVRLPEGQDWPRRVAEALARRE